MLSKYNGRRSFILIYIKEQNSCVQLDNSIKIYRHRTKYTGTIPANTVYYLKLLEYNQWRDAKLTLIGGVVNYPSEAVFVSIPQVNDDGAIITRLWNPQNRPITYEDMEILTYFIKDELVEGNEF